MSQYMQQQQEKRAEEQSKRIAEAMKKMAEGKPVSLTHLSQTCHHVFIHSIAHICCLVYVRRLCLLASHHTLCILITIISCSMNVCHFSLTTVFFHSGLFLLYLREAAGSHQAIRSTRSSEDSVIRKAKETLYTYRYAPSPAVSLCVHGTMHEKWQSGVC